MIYLKDILLETKIAHTQKSLQWVYHDYIPMTPKVIQQIMGNTPITTFHNLDWFAIKNQLPKVCLLYTSPSPRDAHESRMPSSA